MDTISVLFLLLAPLLPALFTKVRWPEYRRYLGKGVWLVIPRPFFRSSNYKQYELVDTVMYVKREAFMLEFFGDWNDYQIDPIYLGC